MWPTFALSSVLWKCCLTKCFFFPCRLFFSTICVQWVTTLTAGQETAQRFLWRAYNILSAVRRIVTVVVLVSLKNSWNYCIYWTFLLSKFCDFPCLLFCFLPLLVLNLCFTFRLLGAFSYELGHAVAWWLRYYSTSQKVVGSTPDEVKYLFSIHLILPGTLDLGVHSAPSKNEYQKQKIIMFLGSEV
jgi:hypothetical protein